MVYKIFEGNMEKFEKKVLSMIRKCDKYNNVFKYERKDAVYETETNKLTGEKYTYKYYIVELSGVIKCDGWQVVAMLEATDSGNLVKTSSDNDVEIPQHYIDNPLVCEHCNRNRKRKYSFILYNENTGEYKSVGKSCLSDFVGKDLEHVAQWYEMQERITKFAAPITEKRYIYYDNLEVLSYAVAIIKIFGYRKTIQDESTVYKTLCYMRPAKSDIKEMKSYNFTITDEDVNKSRDIVKYFSTCETNSDYMHNLQVLCKNGYTTSKDLGLLVSAVASYDRHLEWMRKQEEKQAKLKALAEKNAASSYIGSVGDKITASVKSWKLVFSYDTQWGTTRIYEFTTTDNNIVIWKTSTFIDANATPQNILVTGKIKEHKDYKETKQTVLTRCKIEFQEVKRDRAQTCN